MPDDSGQPTGSETQTGPAAVWRFDVWAACTGGLGAAGTIALAMWLWPLHGPAAGLLLICGVLAGIGSLRCWYRVSQRERLLEEQARQVRAEREALQSERREWEDTQRQLLARLREEADLIARRWEELHDRMLTFHEWMEYPQPIDLRSPTSAGAVSWPLSDRGPTEGAESTAADTPPRTDGQTDRELRGLVEKDRRVLELLEEESARLYEAIRNNEFTVDGRFSWEKLRDELHALIVRVAQVYKPESQDPLLETSMEKLLRAGSRVCLHVLVLLESLPVAAHQYSIREIHNYVRTAAHAYGAYQTVAPWLNVARYALIPGRVVLGANPLTAAAWWGGSEAFRLGARAVARRFVDRWAIQFLHSLVRVIAYEAAGIYGGDFRHRDANWIYGAELVNLVAAFPLSRESLRAALSEVSRLQLRNEYDRVYLYRCLSVHTCPAGLLPGEYVLTEEERQAVAARLEKFYAQHIHGRTPARLQQWREGVEGRLGLRLRVQPDASASTSQDTSEKLHEAARSLAGFLDVAKGLSSAEIRRRLAQSQTLQQASAELRQKLLDEIAADRPEVFEPPDLDPDDALVRPYLSDLIRWNFELRPFSPVGDDLVREAAVHFRLLDDDFEERVEQIAAEWFASTRWREAPRNTPPLSILWALRSSLEKDEVPLLAYPDARLCGAEGGAADVDVASRRWLIGTDRRLLVFAERGEHAELQWECRRDEPVTVRRVAGRVWDDCLLRGGHPVGAALPEDTEFRLSSGWLGSFDTDFAALVRWAKSTGGAGGPDEAAES